MGHRVSDSPESKREEALRGEAQDSAPPLLGTHGPDKACWGGDMVFIQDSSPSIASQVQSLSAIDELLERDKQRETDGFPRKIRVGRLVKPGRGGKDKIILVPTTVEEKFIHDARSEETEEESTSGGTGEGKEGEVIGEEPADGTPGEGGQGAGPGGGEEAAHEIESSAYDLGKVLGEKFELPNLKNKGTKRSLTRFTYDLTDRHARNGQLLDKKATLKKVVQTNINLGNITDSGEIDLARFLVSPQDQVYRILSKEKDYESQAMIFFLRDYSGSMAGPPTDAVVTQHVLIYSWILYQYERQVETKFILHDTTAREVTDFYTYYNSSVAGGTRVESAYRLVNEIVEAGNLARDYNIYVFHGTDGDDWDSQGHDTVAEIRKTLGFASRVGVTIAGSSPGGSTTVEKYIANSGLLEEFAQALRIDKVGENATEVQLIEGIKRLLS
ncbi:MAG: DUF444 family protein [Syntrophobacteraceae bacterium]|nr:DUF444 family protein [Syntrophobacteraceae bacterium]